MTQTIHERKVLREQLAEYDRQLQAGRCDMRKRLAEHPPGLNDLRKMTREASRDETAAMAVVGWVFVVIVGIGLGALFASWLTDDAVPVISAIRCER